MAGEDPEHLAFVRSLPCCAPGCGRRGCVAHHERNHTGMGKRAHDHRSMPLCPPHHDDFHGARGPFEGWSAQRRRDWQRAQAEAARAANEVAADEIAECF